MTTIKLNLAELIPLSAFEDPINAAILLSLFCDARHEKERGWWGDALASDAYDEWGSLLWTAVVGKNTPETLRKVEDFSEAALNWMIKDKVAKTIKATAIAQGEALYLSIAIDGEPINLEIN